MRFYKLTDAAHETLARIREEYPDLQPYQLPPAVKAEYLAAIADHVPGQYFDLEDRCL